MDRGYWNGYGKEPCALHLVHCGVKQNQPGELCDLSIREMYLLHCVLRGKGVYRMDGQEYALGPGDVFAIYPEDLVSYQADETEPWQFCWVGFQGSEAARCYETVGIRREYPIVHLHGNAFETGVSHCLDYIEENEARLSPLRLAGFICEILSAFESSEPVGKQEREQAYVDKALRYIEHDLHRRILVSDVVTHVGLEHSYFYRIFKKQMGVSPETYLIRQRIEKAKKYLRAGVPCKEIPALIGMSDVYYFFRTFKRITGITPSAYRRDGG